MELSTLIYLADIVSGLSVFLVAVGLVTGAIGFIVAAEFSGENERKVVVIAISGIALGLLLILGAVLVPSKQAIYMIFGAEVAQKVAATPEAQEIAGKLLRLANQKLDQALENKK